MEKMFLSVYLRYVYNTVSVYAVVFIKLYIKNTTFGCEVKNWRTGKI